MKFSRLLAESGLDGVRRLGPDVEVAAVRIDSRRCAAGSCFVAVRGTKQDGHAHIAAALSAGASAVVCQDSSAVPPDTPAALLPDTRAAAGPLAQALLGWPARKLTCLAVTGTNGKTTVTYLLRAMLRATGHRPALLGTIAYETLQRTAPASTTTPDPIELAEMTAEMVRAGSTHLVMEASSHALDQSRTAGVAFRVAIFTNLTGDHLDYHQTMEAYAAAKRKLFEGLSSDAAAVINRDDPAGAAMAEATAARVLWYGLSPLADVRARVERIDEAGTHFALVTPAGEVAAHTGLIGRHNVYNFLAAAGAGVALGMTPGDVAAALQTVGHVPGRLQPVPGEAPFSVFVDYAHTDDALSNVLSSLRPLTRGRLILVFGCGGDRDRTKRPRMARVAERLADRLVITSDNPRGEEPQAIVEEILAGLSSAGRAKASVELDRAAAIGQAVGMAREGDVVLIAGKGHENYQILGDRRIHFDDVEVASAALGGQSIPTAEGRE